MSNSSAPRVVSLGALYLDIICHRFPMDGFVPNEQEVVGSAYDTLPGGSAVNFARTAASLGLAPTLVGKTGDDFAARELHSLLSTTGIELCTAQSYDVTTNISITFNSAAGSTLITTIGTANHSMTAEDVVPVVEAALVGARYLYLGGCLKLTALLPSLLHLARRAHDEGALVVVDHGRVFNSLSDASRDAVRQLCAVADIYLPSMNELLLLWEVDSVDAAIRAQPGDGLVVVKDAMRGATAYSGGEQIHARAHRVDVHNPVGAGDAFNAGFIHAHSRGLSLVDCLAEACATAALKVSRRQLPTHDEVLALVDQAP